MSKAAALVEARRRWGRNAAIRADRRPSSKPERERASTYLAAHRATKPERWESEEQRKVWRKRLDDLQSVALYHRYSVGRIDLGMFFCVLGQGDSWEDAFANATRLKR